MQLRVGCFCYKRLSKCINDKFTVLAKQRNLENKIIYQALIYPVTDDTFNTASYYEFGRDFPLTRKIMEFFWDHYIEKADRENILACPLKATRDDLKDLPPALIITAEVDVIRDGNYI